MRKNMLMAAIAATLLAACGGSGSGSHNQAAQPENPSTPLPGQTPAPGASAAAYAGNAYIVPAGTSAPTQTHATSSNSIAAINANGKTVEVQVPGIISGGFTNLGGVVYNGKSYERFIVSGTKYAGKFGIVRENGQDYIFSHGVPTANMPAQGRVAYDGDALVASGRDVTIADADFIADFGQKTLTGAITPDSSSTFLFRAIPINAQISGNRFSAENSQGYFYGANAAEVGGVFQDSAQGIAGSFAADRD